MKITERKELLNAQKRKLFKPVWCKWCKCWHEKGYKHR